MLIENVDESNIYYEHKLVLHLIIVKLYCIDFLVLPILNCIYSNQFLSDLFQKKTIEKICKLKSNVLVDKQKYAEANIESIFNS